MIKDSCISYSSCPICNSDKIQKVLNLKDYTVSNEMFEVWHCDACTVRFTQHVPDLAHIGPYYKASNYISHSDTQVGFIYKCYHFVRNYTLGLKLKMIQKVTKIQKGNLLDVGAGTGAFSKKMKDAGWEVTGLEPDETARANAKTINNIDLLNTDNLFTLTQNNYDVITMWHVLEHVHDLHPYLKQFNSILKESGCLIIAVPNYTSFDSEYYNAFWAAYDVPRHLYHFSPESMKQLAALHGFRIKQVRPMWFDSFYVSLLSEQYKNGKNNYITSFMIGFVSNLKTLFNNKCSSLIYILEKTN